MSDANRQRTQADDSSHVGVVFPMPAPPAPRGAPHGEPVSPVQPLGSDAGSSSQYSSAPASGVKYSSSSSASDGVDASTIPAPAARPGAETSSATNTSGDEVSADETAARAQADAAVRAANSARAAAEAAARASRAAAAAAGSGGAYHSTHSADESSGVGYNAEEEDSGFGPLPDLDFADRVWRARRQEGQTRLLSRVEMSSMSSASSRSYGRDFDGAASERSAATASSRRGAKRGGVGTAAGEGRREDGAGGALRMDLEEEKHRARMGGGVCVYVYSSRVCTASPLCSCCRRLFEARPTHAHPVWSSNTWREKARRNERWSHFSSVGVSQR